MKKAPPFKIELIHIAGPDKGRIDTFLNHDISFGRHPSCDVQFPADLKGVSRRHASIKREGNRFKIIDSSTNGTYLNGKPIKEAYLKNGDVITFALSGPKISFLSEKLPDLPGEIGDESAAVVRPAVPTGGTPSEEPLRQPQPSKTPDASIRQKTPDFPPPEASPSNQSFMPIVIQLGPVIRSYDKPSVTIGSETDDDFTIDSPSREKVKLRIFFQDGRYWAQDPSYNGKITINNNLLDEPLSLSPGDTIELGGGKIRLEFLGEGRFAEVQ